LVGGVGGCGVEDMDDVEGRVEYAVGEKKRRTWYVDFISSLHTATVHPYTVSSRSVLFLDLLSGCLCSAYMDANTSATIFTHRSKLSIHQLHHPH